MEMIFAVVYYLCRYPYKNGVREMFKTGLKISIYTIMGILIAAPILLPEVNALLGNARMENKGVVQILYSLSEYKEVIGNFIGSNSFSYYSYIGISPCILSGIVLLFIENKKKWLKLLLLITVLSCLMPGLGYMMNGFSYVANRHVWLYTFLVTSIFSIEFEEFLNIEKKKQILMCVIVGIYLLLLILFPYSSSKESKIASMLLIAGIIAINVSVYFRSYKIFAVTMFTLVIIGIGNHTYSVFGERGGKDKFLSNESVLQYYSEEFGEAYDEVIDNTLWRMDWDTGAKKPNSINIAKKAGSTYSYWSFQNNDLVKYLYEHGLLEISYLFTGLNNRMYLQSLLGCKYIVSETGFNDEGYDMIDKELHIYKNNNYLPIVRIYQHAEAKELWLNATYGEKQSSEVVNCITNEPVVVNNFSKVNTDVAQRQIEYKLVVGSQNEITENGFKINDPNEPIEIELVSELQEGELYLELYNLNYLEEYNGKNVLISVKSATSSDMISYVNTMDKYYSGFRNFNFNLGKLSRETKKIQLYLGECGEYSFDNLIIESIPTNAYIELVNNEKFAENISSTLIKYGLKVSATTNEDVILYVSLPYSSGWSVEIDGKPAEIFKANIMGMGVILPLGTHNVEFEYCTPFLIEGMYLAVIGMLGILGISMIRRKVK